jgi:hypothetical protein
MLFRVGSERFCGSAAAVDPEGIGGRAAGASLSWTEKQSFSAHRWAKPVPCRPLDNMSVKLLDRASIRDVSYEKDYQLESKYENNSSGRIDALDNATVVGRIRAAKTNYRLCSG